ncbi:MAG: dockerin type I domain-containing protein [Clostridia bacterium]|nr:dockerin type I domain-containing protein [Clostridia bacterium]
MRFKRAFALVLAVALAVMPLSFGVAVEGVMGDLNGDGQVTASDAASILRIVVRIQTATEAQTVLGDLDHNSELSAADAAQLLRYIVRIEPKVELVFEQEADDFRFIPEENKSTITGYIGNAADIVVPLVLTGHPVFAFAPNSMSGIRAQTIRFLGAPPEGVEDAGIPIGTTILYPLYYEDEWLALGLEGYNLLAYGEGGIAVTFEVSETVHTYDGEPAEIVAVPSLAGASYRVIYTQNSVQTVPINAGSYQYSIEVTQGGCYASGNNITGTLTINKADYDMSGVTFEDKRCEQDDDTQLKYFSIEISGTLPAGVSVSYWFVNDPDTEADDTPFEPQSEKGDYLVAAKFSGDYLNYNRIADMRATLTIINNWSSGWLSN